MKRNTDLMNKGLKLSPKGGGDWFRLPKRNTDLMNKGLKQISPRFNQFLAEHLEKKH